MTKHIETAPERIWLQISENDVDAAFPFPKNAGDVTWCADSVVAVEVKYVRADLAEQQRDKLLAALEGLAGDIQSLIHESSGVAGLHLNYDLAPWYELEAGGRFERLTHLPIAVEAIAAAACRDEILARGKKGQS